MVILGEYNGITIITHGWEIPELALKLWFLVAKTHPTKRLSFHQTIFEYQGVRG
jgi:hypothetical protein